MRVHCLLLTLLLCVVNLVTGCAQLVKKEALLSELLIIPPPQENIRIPEGAREKLIVMANLLCMEGHHLRSTEECLERLYHGLAGSFDPHTYYKSGKEDEHDESQYGGVGIRINKSELNTPIVVLSVIEESPAWEANIKRGDLITKINNIPTTGRETGELIRVIRGDLGTMVTLEIHRMGSEPFEVTLMRKKIIVPNIFGSLIRTDSSGHTYAYVKLQQFDFGTSLQLKDKLTALHNEANGPLSGIILDLRGNPGGQLNEAIATVDLFLDSQSVVLGRTQSGIAKKNIPSFMATDGDITNGLPLLVLVSGSSASGAEILSGALQHFRRAVIAGTRTYRKGLIQEVFPLPFSGELRVTTEEYLIGTIDDWVSVQCIGVIPDIAFPDEAELVETNIPSECDDPKSMKSMGPMEHPPKHPPMKEVNPQLYEAALRMLKVYRAHEMKDMDKTP